MCLVNSQNTCTCVSVYLVSGGVTCLSVPSRAKCSQLAVAKPLVSLDRLSLSPCPLPPLCQDKQEISPGAWRKSGSRACSVERRCSGSKKELQQKERRKNEWKTLTFHRDLLKKKHKRRKETKQ